MEVDQLWQFLLYRNESLFKIWYDQQNEKRIKRIGKKVTDIYYNMNGVDYKDKSYDNCKYS